MNLKKPYIILGIGVGVGVFSCAVHFLSRKNKEEILKTTRNRVTRTLKISKGFVGHVLGRGGSTIKTIREKTNARIVFEDQGQDFTIATISGSPDEVDDAVNEINEILNSRKATVTREIIISESVSDSAFKSVGTVRHICDLTKAKITLDFLPSKKKDASCVKVVIKGSKEEVDAAVDLIDEIVAEVELSSTKTVHVAGRALPNNIPLHPSIAKNKALSYEKLIPSNPDGFVEVYVSAVDTPKKFWVQISGSKSIQLDKLATVMTEFYDDERNRNKLQPAKIDVGEIVAAYFQGDNSWYRAQVIKMSDDLEQNVSVFYLDFGDCATLSLDSLAFLKPEFLTIPFQAIECSLLNVEPITDKWTDEAIDEFEKLVHLDRWKVIMAKPLKQESSELAADKTIEYVKLLDTNTEKDLDIAVELVSKGYANFALQ